MEVPYEPQTPAPFAVGELRAGNRIVLVAAGEIDIATVPALHAALARAYATGADEVWLDLSAVDFMDSTGIHALVDAEHRLAVICPDGPVRRVLTVAGVDIPLHEPAVPLR
jgi:anti-sigma B factor antagonist